MITLRKVDSRNIWDLTKLSVADSQRNFVATNTESILEAYCAITAGGVAMPYGIYDVAHSSRCSCSNRQSLLTTN